VEVKTWQALYAMFLPERSGFGLNELLGRKVAEVEPSARVSARDKGVFAGVLDGAGTASATRKCGEKRLALAINVLCQVPRPTTCATREPDARHEADGQTRRSTRRRQRHCSSAT